MSERQTIILPRLHRNQRRIRAESQRFQVVNCGRRWGKTVTGIRLACDTALDGWPVGWFAPEYRLLREAWREIKDILAPAIRSVSEQEKRIELRPGADGRVGIVECWAFDRNPNAGRSRKYKRVVIDEAAHCDYLERVWTKAIRPTLTDYRGDAWFLSSPNGPNYFKVLYDKGQQRERGWISWTQTSYDNPYIDPAEIDEAKADLPPDVFDQEYLAKFLTESHYQLIPASWLDFAHAAKRAKGHAGPRRLSIDISKGTGRDRTVVIVADDLGLLDLIVSNTVSLVEAANLVLKASTHYGIDHENLAYDAGGWAGPDFGRYLEALGIMGATPYTGGAAGGRRWKNRRARAAWALRQRLDPTRDQLLAPPSPGPVPDYAYPAIAGRKGVPEIQKARKQPPFAIPSSIVGEHWSDMRQELSELRYTHGGAKIELEKKEDLVERLGRSPDLGDAMLMLASLWGVEV